VTGDNPVDARAVAEEEPAGVVEAKTFSAYRSFIGRNHRDPASDQGMMRVVFAEQCGEGGFGSADQRGVEVAGEGDEDRGEIERWCRLRLELLEINDSVAQVFGQGGRGTT